MEQLESSIFCEILKLLFKNALVQRKSKKLLLNVFMKIFVMKILEYCVFFIVPDYTRMWL